MRRLICVAAAGAVLMHADAASAGVFGDDLAKCLVSKTSASDRVAFMQWLFSALSTGEAVKGMAVITPAQRVVYEKQGVALMERLMLVDCRSQAVAAIRSEGSSGIEAGFQVFGETAARDLMSDPAVSASMAGLDKYLDKPRWDALGKEAGVHAAK